MHHNIAWCIPLIIDQQDQYPSLMTDQQVTNHYSAPSDQPPQQLWWLNIQGGMLSCDDWEIGYPEVLIRLLQKVCFGWDINYRKYFWSQFQQKKESWFTKISEESKGRWWLFSCFHICRGWFWEQLRLHIVLWTKYRYHIFTSCLVSNSALLNKCNMYFISSTDKYCLWQDLRLCIAWT